MENYISIFPDDRLITRFLRTLDLYFGGQQTMEPTFTETSIRRFFRSVNYLNEINHSYNANDDIGKPNMSLFFKQGIIHVRDYLLKKFSDEYVDKERRTELDQKLDRVFSGGATDWIGGFAFIAKLARFNVVHLKKGKYCAFCGGWWHLESLKSPHHFISGTDPEIDWEGIENQDEIYPIMKVKYISYENQILTLIPLILLPPRPTVEVDKICRFCHQQLDDNTMIVKGRTCPDQHNDHFLHFRCSLGWFQQQVVVNHVENPTCPAGHPCALEFGDFLNLSDYRSLQQFWVISAKTREIKFNRARNAFN